MGNSCQVFTSVGAEVPICWPEQLSYRCLQKIFFYWVVMIYLSLSIWLCFGQIKMLELAIYIRAEQTSSFSFSKIQNIIIVHFFPCINLLRYKVYKYLAMPRLWGLLVEEHGTTVVQINARKQSSGGKGCPGTILVTAVLWGSLLQQQHDLCR